jgi:hypothetical protein
VSIANADAEVAEEQAQSGGEEQFHGDLEQEAVLASFNAEPCTRIREQVLEKTNATNFEHAVQILRERAAKEEACHFLMVAERQRLLELNAQCQAEAAAREKARPRTRNPASRRRC